MLLQFDGPSDFVRVVMNFFFLVDEGVGGIVRGLAIVIGVPLELGLSGVHNKIIV